MSIKSGFVTNLGRSKLCAAVVVVIAAVFRLARTSQKGGGVYSSFLSILLHFLLVQIYVTSSSFLGVVGWVPWSGGG